MKITYLGQAGFLFDTGTLKIMIDPYLSDSVSKVQPRNYRRVAVDERFLKVQPDILIFTHNHLDHYDPETVHHYLCGDRTVTVLAPGSVWTEVRKFAGNHNYVLFNRHTSWSEEGITFTAVKAEHSDPTPIGVILDDGDKKYYITGDTLYNEEIFQDIPEDIYALFLPINGVGNNMNAIDAERFIKRIRPQKVVPMHIGMFDEITADLLSCESKVVAKIYEEVTL